MPVAERMPVAHNRRGSSLRFIEISYRGGNNRRADEFRALRKSAGLQARKSNYEICRWHRPGDLSPRSSCNLSLISRMAKPVCTPALQPEDGDAVDQRSCSESP